VTSDDHGAKEAPRGPSFDQRTRLSPLSQAYAATVPDRAASGGLLLAYSLGYVSPLVIAASATEAATDLAGLRARTAWVTPLCGGLLVTGGTYGLLTRLCE